MEIDPLLTDSNKYNTCKFCTGVDTKFEKSALHDPKK